MSPLIRSTSIAALVAQLALPVGPALSSPPPPRPPAPWRSLVVDYRIAASTAGGGRSDAGSEVRVRPDPGHRLAFAAAEPAEENEPNGEPDGEPVEEVGEPTLHQPGSESAGRQYQKSSWWVWTGTAAVVGLFVAGLSYDLSHDDRPAERPALPWFPNAP